MKNCQAKVLADTRNMTREEWLEQRKKGIGGSDASVIMGCNPYSSPLGLYLEKVGKTEEKEQTEAMRQGTDLEAYVANRFLEYMKQNGTPVNIHRVNRILQHPEYPWMLANIDRDIEKVDAGLECKTCSPFTKFDFDAGEINPHYYWQAMHYMAVTGASAWYVAILVLGKDFYVFKVDRDEGQINALIEAEKAFWNDNVLAGVPPLPNGSDMDDAALETAYPQGDDREEAIDLMSEDDALNLRAMKVEQRDKLDSEIKTIDQQIKQALGECQRGISPNWRISWTNTSTSRIDAKLLKAKYPQIAEEVTKTTAGRRFSVARVKEGT